METHHHGHVHHTSKWKEYLFQFCMLFLAVFLGFLAEYRLEHFIENKRTIDLAKNLYQELKTDSIRAQKNLGDRIFKEECLKFLRKYFRDSSFSPLSGKFYPNMGLGFFLTTTFLFEPKDGVLSQLRNSGALRYFRNPQLQQYLGDIAVAINNIRLRNEQEYSFMSENIRPFLFRHYDYEWHNLITKDGTIPALEALQNYLSADSSLHADFKNIKILDRQALYNIVSHYLIILRGTRQIQLAPYVEINIFLLKSLRDNYDVED